MNIDWIQEQDFAAKMVRPNECKLQPGDWVTAITFCGPPDRRRVLGVFGKVLELRAEVWLTSDHGGGEVRKGEIWLKIKVYGLPGTPPERRPLAWVPLGHVKPFPAETRALS